MKRWEKSEDVCKNVDPRQYESCWESSAAAGASLNSSVELQADESGRRAGMRV